MKTTYDDTKGLTVVDFDFSAAYDENPCYEGDPEINSTEPGDITEFED